MVKHFVEVNRVESKIINGKEYRLIYIRGRGKWISKDGDAYNPIRFNQKATIRINTDGYPCFGGGVPVHLYVATAWVEGWFEGAEVDHIDYDRSNYSAGNLRWVTHEDNIAHSSKDENHYKGALSGEVNGRSVLTSDDVIMIKDMFDNGMTTMEVIKTLHPNLDFSQRKRLWNRYNRVKTGETWATV